MVLVVDGTEASLTFPGRAKNLSTGGSQRAPARSIERRWERMLKKYNGTGYLGYRELNLN